MEAARLQRLNDNIINKAEELLKKLKINKKMLEEIEAQYIEEVEAIKKKYYNQIEDIKKEIRKTEEELQKHALKHKYKLFKGDIAELKEGRLILQVKLAVKRVRGVLEKLERLGWVEAIKIEKKVNWDVIENWPDERLIAIGSERVQKETVTYELKW